MAEQQNLYSIKPLIGVSACLLGQRVRYDGQHKRNEQVLSLIQQHFEYLTFCPETAIGLGVPRPPIQLVGSLENPRALGIKNPGLDVTLPLLSYGKEQAEKYPLSGFIFKKNSPSCGPGSVRLVSPDGEESRTATGLFAKAIQHTLPLLPVTDEYRLQEPSARENFVQQVKLYSGWQEIQTGISVQQLETFHQQQKYWLSEKSGEEQNRIQKQYETACQNIESKSNRENYLSCLLNSIKS